MTSPVRWDDWLAITELKARYCRYLDTKQWDKWADCFTPDYELDVSDKSGLPVIRGRDAVLASVRGFVETAVTCHHAHLPEITVEGDSAQAIWAMRDHVIFAAGGEIRGTGHYHDTLVKTDGQWRISRLKLTRLHIDRRPAPLPQSAA